MGKIIKIRTPRKIVIIANNVIVKKITTHKSDEDLFSDCAIRTRNTGKITTFAIIPFNFQ